MVHIQPASESFNVAAQIVNVSNPIPVNTPGEDIAAYYAEVAQHYAERTEDMLDEAMATKVSKTGDSMTGDLTINKTTPTIFGKAIGLDKTSTTAPSSDIVGTVLQTQDENGNYVSNFYTTHNIYNNFATGLSQQRTINGVNKESYFDINIAVDGTDFAGATAGVKQSITNWSFPSNRYDDLALGASGTQYTAAADGYVFLWGTQYGTSGYIFLRDDANGLQVVSQPTNVNSFEVRAWIPVAKGDSYTIEYGDLYVNGFRFIYANGES